MAALRRERQRTLKGALPAEPVANIVDCFQSYHYGHVEEGQVGVDRLMVDWETTDEFLWMREE